MLHPETVESGTFSLLRELMELPALAPFSLVGGTALALQFGHRSSIDIDLFYHEEFDHREIVAALEKEFGSRFDYKQQHTRFGIFCFIDNVKVDLVHYPHQQISDILIENGIRIYGNADIAAMKIQAILGRAKKKDFWDLHELLKHYSLQQLIDWHKQKFPGQMLAISIPHAITYYIDADESDPPVSFKGQTWPKIKKDISKVVSDFLR
ncbi:MAG: nucleotidyl transferase AbiEii/AbiGii toxin family protein [Bacteroidales bacterium]|nr:nucleotidyl transferase AbiEii/AbiGii toxin family protein [Bacteroidales bacterium]